MRAFSAARGHSVKCFAGTASQFKSVKPVGGRVFVNSIRGVLLISRAQKNSTAGTVVPLGDIITVKVPCAKKAAAKERVKTKRGEVSTPACSSSSGSDHVAADETEEEEGEAADIQESASLWSEAVRVHYAFRLLDIVEELAEVIPAGCTGPIVDLVRQAYTSEGGKWKPTSDELYPEYSAKLLVRQLRDLRDKGVPRLVQGAMPHHAELVRRCEDILELFPGHDEELHAPQPVETESIKYQNRLLYLIDDLAGLYFSGTGETCSGQGVSLLRNAYKRGGRYWKPIRDGPRSDGNNQKAHELVQELRDLRDKGVAELVQGDMPCHAEVVRCWEEILDLFEVPCATKAAAKELVKSKRGKGSELACVSSSASDHETADEMEEKEGEAADKQDYASLRSEAVRVHYEFRLLDIVDDLAEVIPEGCTGPTVDLVRQAYTSEGGKWKPTSDEPYPEYIAKLLFRQLRDLRDMDVPRLVQGTMPHHAELVRRCEDILELFPGHDEELHAPQPVENESIMYQNRLLYLIDDLAGLYFSGTGETCSEQGVILLRNAYERGGRHWKPIRDGPRSDGNNQKAHELVQELRDLRDKGVAELVQGDMPCHAEVVRCWEEILDLFEVPCATKEAVRERVKTKSGKGSKPACVDSSGSDQEAADEMEEEVADKQDA